MSDETPILDAIAQQLRDDGISGMVTGYIMVAEYVDDDGDACYFWAAPGEQRLMTSIGQVEWLRLLLRRSATTMFAAMEDDD